MPAPRSDKFYELRSKMSMSQPTRRSRIPAAKPVSEPPTIAAFLVTLLLPSHNAHTPSLHWFVFAISSFSVAASSSSRCAPEARNCP